MNIFRLHDDPEIAAQMHCDKHVVKMILESAQMLSTAHRVLDGDDYANENNLYKATHKNHPSNVWVRESSHNYSWLWLLFAELLVEYKKRYNKVHACSKLQSILFSEPRSLMYEPQHTKKQKTLLPQCMPDQYKVEGDPVTAYRNYYKGEKAYFAKWAKGTAAPTWWN